MALCCAGDPSVTHQHLNICQLATLAPALYRCFVWHAGTCTVLHFILHGYPGIYACMLASYVNSACATVCVSSVSRAAINEASAPRNVQLYVQYQSDCV